jgi:hypothetical protein
MNSTTLEWLKAQLTPLAGAPYEPWVQLLQFLLVVATFVSAIAWVLTRRHVIAMVHQAWSLLKQGDRAIKRTTRYAPEMERQRQRWEPYVALVGHLCMSACHIACFMLAIFGIVITVKDGMWGLFVTVMIFGIFFLFAGRGELAAATWAWHSIKTGEAFTWPRPNDAPRH